MAPDKLENGAQNCLSKLIAGYLCLSFLVCILLDTVTLSHFSKSTPIYLQVVQPLS